MTETANRPRLQGRLEWCDSKSIHIQARFDKVAVHKNCLTLISLVAYSADVGRAAPRGGIRVGPGPGLHRALPPANSPISVLHPDAVNGPAVTLP